MKNIVIALVLIYLGVGLYLYLKQRSFIYFPTPMTSNGLDEQIFEIETQKIKVTVLNRGQQQAIIYFGGNAESVDDNAEQFLRLFSNYTVYLVKYRGFSGSTGSPSENVIYSDALYIYDELSPSHADISLIGRSLGTGVATYVAVKRPIEKLLLITPYDSVQSVAQSRYPIYPINILLKDKFDSYSRAKHITAKTLVIAAEQDNIIERVHTERLLKGFTQPVQFEVIQGVGHNDITYHSAYEMLLRQFF